MVDWPILWTVKYLQNFLGFANIYREFSSIALPLIALLGRVQTPSMESYRRSCRDTTKESIQCYPKQTRFFIVEVYATEMRSGGCAFAVLWREDQVASIGLFSHKLSSAEQNYDMGGRELLAVCMFCSSYPEDQAQLTLPHSSFQYLLGYQSPLLPWNVNTTDSPAVDAWFGCHN